MSIGQSLSRLALKRLVDDVFTIGGADALDALIDFLTQFGDGDPAALSTTLEQALERGWRALEEALEDDSFRNGGQVGLDSGDARSFRLRLEGVLSDLARGKNRELGLTAVESGLRQQCLGELRAARESGALAGSLDIDEWAKSSEIFSRFAVAQAQADNERRTEGELIGELERQGCVGLMRLLVGSAGLPLVLRVVRAFLCQGLMSLLRRCLQVHPELTPTNCAVIRMIFQELYSPLFSTPMPRLPTMAAPMEATAPPPIRLRLIADSSPLAARETIAAPARYPRSAQIVVTAFVALILFASAWLIGDASRRHAAERQRMLAERALLAEERLRLDEERRRSIEQEQRWVEEETSRQKAAQRRKQEEERRRRIKVEEGGRRAEAQAAEEREAERRRNQQERLAKLRKERERRARAPRVFENGLTHAACRRDEKALLAFTEALELDPNLSGAWTERGVVRRRLGDKDGALSDFREAVRRDPRDLRAWLNRGELHSQRDENSQAVEAFNAVIHLEPRNAPAYRERGVCHMRSDDHEKALADETAAIRLDPRDPWPYYYRAEVHRLRRDIEKALADYDASISRNRDSDPALAPAYRQRGLIHLDRQEQAWAIDDLSQALRLHADDNVARHARALAYLQSKEWEKAARDALALIAHDPDNPEGYRIRGHANLARTRYRAACDDFTQAIKHHGGDAQTCYLRARARVQLGEIDEAIVDCNHAISGNPHLADAYYLRGTLYIEQGLPAHGRDDRRKAHQLNPLYPLP